MNDERNRGKFAQFPEERSTTIENSHDDPSTSQKSRTGLFKVSSRKFDESIERYYSIPPSCRPSSAFFNHSKRINHPSRGPRSLLAPFTLRPRRPAKLGRPTPLATAPRAALPLLNDVIKGDHFRRFSSVLLVTVMEM